MTAFGKRIAILGSLVALVSLAGCGTTQIIASDPQALILVDGQPLGRGMASVGQTGLPGTVQVVAKTEDGRSVTQPMSRSFGWTAGLLGFVTYGVCFFACWQYPGALYLALPTPLAPYAPDSVGWNTPGASRAFQDPWTTPPEGWQGPDQPRAKAQPTAAPSPMQTTAADAAPSATPAPAATKPANTRTK